MMGSLTLWMWYFYDLPLEISLLIRKHVWISVFPDSSHSWGLLQFFHMNKLDAIKAQDIYRRTGNLVCMTAA
jgi:hypothetical protein